MYHSIRNYGINHNAVVIFIDTTLARTYFLF